MSNILKQYYIADNVGSVRKINNNEKIKKRVVVAPAHPVPNLESGDEFVDGIMVEQVDSVNAELEKEKILEEARAEANAIVEEANEQVKKLLDEAKQRAQILYADNKSKGYEDGIEEKEKEFKNKRVELEKEYNQKKDQLEKEYSSYMQELESDLIDAIIQVFGKVFHIQFAEKKEILLHLVKNTIANIEVGKEFRIHVAHTNYKFMIAHIDEVRERIGNDIDIEVVNDANLDASGCQIETSFGVFDCGIDMELNNLVNDIKSLCC